MITQSLFLHADLAPVPGVANPGPPQKYKDPRLIIRERELPALDDFSVRVEMLFAGICGTDLHLLKKKMAAATSSVRRPSRFLPKAG